MTIRGAAIGLAFGSLIACVAQSYEPASSSGFRALSAGAPAYSQQFTVLHQFAGFPDGRNPGGSVTFDAAGDIIGTTYYGGTYDCGTVFKLTPSGSGYRERIVHSFRDKADGCGPNDAPLLDKGGDVFVTVSEGGRHFNNGTAVALRPSGNVYEDSSVYSFGRGHDGQNPNAGLTAIGNALYSTTINGGKYDYGTLVGLTPSLLSESVLIDFDGPNGQTPFAGLAADKAGALYGTTYEGGANGAGTVFKFVPGANGGTQTILWSFNGTDGGGPWGGVILDAAGNIYGTTLYASNGGGTVFKLTPGPNGYTETVLQMLGGASGGASMPFGGVVAIGHQLFGTSSAGGALGYGCIFRVSDTGKDYEVLHSFSGSDGQNPGGQLAADGRALYGTTSSGGTYQDGVVFRYVP